MRGDSIDADERADRQIGQHDGHEAGTAAEIERRAETFAGRWRDAA